VTRIEANNRLLVDAREIRSDVLVFFAPLKARSKRKFSCERSAMIAFVAPERHFISGGETMDLPREIKKLEFALAVARELHFGKAAARLNVAQSYVSRTIKEFENELGAALFKRDHRRVVALTEAGQNFIPDAEQMLTKLRADYEQAIDVSRTISRRNAASFLIGYSALVPAALPTRIRSIQSVRFPTMRLQFRIVTPSRLFDALARGAFHAGLTFAFSARRDIEQIPIHSEPLHAFFRRKTSANAGTPMRLEDLKESSLVVPSSDRLHPEFRDWLIARCAAAGFTPRIEAEPTSPREAFDLVEDGAELVAVMLDGIGDGMPTSVHSSLILGTEELPLVLAYKRACSPRTQKIVTEISNSLRRANLERAR
jgi:DNA-binding transcriptional LysR family regulator